MALFRGSGGSIEATSNTYANQISQDAQTATAKAIEAALSAEASEAIRLQVQELADSVTKNFFQQPIAPTNSDVNAGDIWYNTATHDFLVYRLVDGMLQWSSLIINDLSNDSDNIDAGAF
jgi:hypothetical protein